MPKVPLVAVDTDARQAMPDLEVSGAAAEPESSGQYLVLTLQYRSIGSLGTEVERTADFALSPRAAAILCRELRGALKRCLLDDLPETE